MTRAVLLLFAGLERQLAQAVENGRDGDCARTPRRQHEMKKGDHSVRCKMLFIGTPEPAGDPPQLSALHAPASQQDTTSLIRRGGGLP